MTLLAVESEMVHVNSLGNPGTTQPRARQKATRPRAELERGANELPKDALIDWFDDDEMFRVFIREEETVHHSRI